MQDSLSDKISSSSGETEGTPPIPIIAYDSFDESESQFGSTPPNLTLSHIPSKRKKEDEFRSLFDLHEDDLLDDFSCAYQNKSFLLHGRMYISNKNVSFYSNILGRKTSKTIPYESIVAIYKKNTAIVFANAIEIVTQSGKYFFTSFMFRDNAYKLLTQVWTDFVNENSSAGQSRVMLKSDGAELFTRHSENENILDESEEERTSVHLNGKKKKRSASPKKYKSLTVKYSTDEEDNFSGDYRSDDDTKRSKKKHKKKKSWPTSKHKSVDPLPDFDAAQDDLVNVDKLLQSNGKKEENKITKRTRRESKSNTPPTAKKEKTKTEETIEISSKPEEEESDDLNEEISGLPFSKDCPHIHTEPEKNQTKIHDRKFKVTPSLFFRLTFKNKKFLEEYADACEYFPEWTAEDWIPTDSSDCCHSRKLNYKIPLNNNIGPKSTRVFATQYARYSNDTNIVMEIQNISKDVPFGESFVVYEIWELKQVEGLKGIKECNIVIKGGIIWKKSAWGLKGTIEKKSLEGSKTHGEIFLNLAQKYIDNHIKRKNMFGNKEKTKNGSSSFDGGRRDSIISQTSDDTKLKSRRTTSVKKKSKEKDTSSLNEPQTIKSHPNEMEILLKRISFIIITLCVIIATVAIIFMTMRLGTIEKYMALDESRSNVYSSIEELREQNLILRKILAAVMNSTELITESA